MSRPRACLCSGREGLHSDRLEDERLAGYKAEAAKYPGSKMLRLEAIQETVPVYEGEFRLTRDVTIGDQKTVMPLLDANGDLTMSGTVRYQACDDEKCFLPVSVPVQWKMHVLPLDRERVPADLQRKQR